MESSPFRSRTALIVPLVLLVVALFEDIVTYKVRQHVADAKTRAAIILVLTGVGFVIAASWIGPWIKQLLATARKGTRWGAGRLGIWIFYAAAYGAIYYAYLVIERHGVGGLLPASLR
ncbi:MAG: hypothetical protein JWO36_5056 [Myxococcales bacterium]|nr:hypothetical protein [Myxococcales bacterium]